jgi:phospholipid transport system substrate-binding protein
MSLFAGVLQAAGPADELKETVDASLDVVFDPANADLSIESKQQKVREILEGRYDLTVLIRRSMGRNWSLLSAAEQEQVVELIKKLIVKAYFKNIDGIRRPEFSFGQTLEVSSKRVEVPATIQAGDKVFNIVFRLGKLQSGWEIYDIVGENISIVSNYRQQMDDHFRKGNGAELITKLENLLSNDEIGNEIKI